MHDDSDAQPAQGQPQPNVYTTQLDKRFIEDSESLVQQIAELNQILKSAVDDPHNKCKKRALEHSRDKLEYAAAKLIHAAPNAPHQAAQLLDQTKATLEETNQLLNEQAEDLSSPHAFFILKDTTLSLEQTCRDLEHKAIKLREHCPCSEIMKISSEHSQTEQFLREGCNCFDRRTNDLCERMKTALDTTKEVTQNFASEVLCRMETNETLAPAYQVAAGFAADIRKNAQILHRKICEDCSKK